MLIGYARVSTGEQTTAAQVAALKTSGCELIFRDNASGGRWDRPELHKLLSQLRKGDVLVVWTLDRLSRSLRDVLTIMERVQERHAGFRAISEFPKWRKYLISLSFRDKSSVRPVQVGGFEANIVVHRSTAVRGRGGPPPPWESSCRTRTGPVEADGTVDAQNAPTAPWKTLRVFHELPQGLSHRITHAKPRKAPKWRWETRIDTAFAASRKRWTPPRPRVG